MINILGISASPRKAGTEYAVKCSLEGAEEVEDVRTKFVTLKGKEIKPCLHCDVCYNTGQCVHDDDAGEIIQTMFEADGIIIGSPVYDMSHNGQLSCLFNRFRSRDKELCKSPRPFAGKVGGAIACGGSRNGGQEITVANILNFYFCQGMSVVGADRWENAGGYVFSEDRSKWDRNYDKIGTEAAYNTGRRVATLAAIIKKNSTGLVLT